MKLVVHQPSRLAACLIKALAALLGIAYMAVCVWFAGRLVGSIWFGVPLGLILCACLPLGLLFLFMNTYDRIIIPISRRRRDRRLDQLRNERDQEIRTDKDIH